MLLLSAVINKYWQKQGRSRTKRNLDVISAWGNRLWRLNLMWISLAQTWLYWLGDQQSVLPHALHSGLLPLWLALLPRCLFALLVHSLADGLCTVLWKQLQHQEKHRRNRQIKKTGVSEKSPSFKWWWGWKQVRWSSFFLCAFVKDSLTLKDSLISTWQHVKITARLQMAAFRSNWETIIGHFLEDALVEKRSITISMFPLRCSMNVWIFDGWDQQLDQRQPVTWQLLMGEKRQG